MIHLGGKAATPQQGRALAETALQDGTALDVFVRMVEAQGGESRVFTDADFHRPGATAVLAAWDSGYISAMDTTQIGWAVQRTGAGREKAGEPVDPHAGIVFHARRGARVEQGQRLATIFATNDGMLAEPAELLRQAITLSGAPPAPVSMVSRVFTRESAEAYLRNAVR
jgi:pyrimidine-nucleoside phosphorylase